MAAFSTTFIERYEMPYFLPDSPLLNISFVLIAILASIYIYIYKRKKTGRLHGIVIRVEQDDAFFSRIRSVLLWAIWFLISLWVVCTQVPPYGDQRAVLLAAQYMAMGDFTPSGPVGYFYVYNNQIGITMVVYLLSRIFGEFNYLAYQLINAVCITFIIKTLSELGQLFGMKRSGALLLLLLGGFFLPLMLYASFVYGIIPGLLLCLLALKYEILYFRSGRSRLAVLSAFCISFAVLLKMNNLIFLVAMLIYAIFYVFGRKYWEKLIYIALIAVFFFAQSTLPALAYEKMSGQEIPEGISMWGWVTMGLQDDERPGWWNGYSRYTFEASEFDVKKQEAWVKADLKARLEEMWQDKDMARDFFVRKAASQWNEPSLQSVMVLISHQQEYYSHDVISVDNEWPKAILSPMGNHILTQCMNYFNFAVLAGAMLWLLLCSKSEHLYDALILPMIFVGGFLFHLVWEVKSQYALPYFVLLLPYTVMGYSKAAECVAALPAKVSGGFTVDKKTLIIKLALLLVAIVILWYVFHGTLGSLTGDSEAYYAYLAEYR